jgi:hypothetical protein
MTIETSIPDDRGLPERTALWSLSTSLIDNSARKAGRKP